MSWGVTTTPILRSVGVTINQRYSLFLCCGNAFTSSNLAGHWPQHCSGRLEAHVSAEIKRVSKYGEMRAEYPDFDCETPLPYEQIAGLPVKQNLYGCPECGNTGTAKGVKRHMKDRQHGKSGAPMMAGLCAQVLNTGSTRTNIRIKLRPAPAESLAAAPDLLAQFKAFNWEDHRTGDIPNARKISPWLMRTRWHEQMAPYREHTVGVRHLVSWPSPENSGMAKLQRTIVAYFQRATQLLDATSELVLQTLNSHDPDKE